MNKKETKKQKKQIDDLPVFRITPQFSQQFFNCRHDWPIVNNYCMGCGKQMRAWFS